MSATIGGKDGDVRVRLRVRPSARKDAILGVRGDRLRVDITAPPVDGKANKAIVRLLAKQLGIHRDAVVVTAGQSSRDKTVSIAVTLAQAEALLP